MFTLLPLAAALASNTGAAPALPAVSAKGLPVYEDKAQDVSVEYVELPTGKVIFTSKLPAGWAFTVNVDGDKNGVWGVGPGKPGDSVETTADHAFGQDSRLGVFCSQFILNSSPNDPSSIYISSECGALKSSGHVIMSGFDRNMHATVTYEIPSDELFGAAPSARIQVCVWNTAKSVCQHSMPDLLELKRKFPAAAKHRPR